MRFGGFGGAGAEGGANLPAHERNASGGAAGEDERSGSQRRIRGLQDLDELRRHGAQSTVVGVSPRACPGWHPAPTILFPSDNFSPPSRRQSFSAEPARASV